MHMQIYDVYGAVVTIFKYTADTVCEQQSAPIACGSFLESRTGNEASFSLQVDKQVPILACPEQEGNQKGMKWAVANPKCQ